MPVSSFERIVSLLNEASLADETKTRVARLLQVKELIIHRDPSLLDNFFEEITAFQHDLNLEVRKTVIAFLQDACHVDPGLLKKAVGCLGYLFSSALHQDPPASSLLRCLTATLAPLYRIALTRAVKVGMIESGVAVGSGNGIAADSAADVALETFRSVASLKDEVVRLVLPSALPGTMSVFGSVPHNSLNDSVRLGIIDLIESVIVLHSRRLPNSEIPRPNESDISLDQVPELTNNQLRGVLEASTASSSATLMPGICLVRPRRLADEAERLISALFSWSMGGGGGGCHEKWMNVTCSILEAVMDALVRIARQRPQFMDRVVQAFETVHVTLPPHFSDAQVGTVRKKLKTGLLQLLRHPAAISDYQGRITILLTDLGATQHEVLESLHHAREPAAAHQSRDLIGRQAVSGVDVDMRCPPASGSYSSLGRQDRSAVSLGLTDFDARQQQPQQQQQQQQQQQSVARSQDGGGVGHEAVVVVVAKAKATSSTPGDKDERVAPVDTSCSAPAQSLSPSSKQQQQHSISSQLQQERSPFRKTVFSLNEAEAALRFDNDDDDDDDDYEEEEMLTARSRRLARRAARRRQQQQAMLPGGGGGGGADMGGPGKELPPVDLVTSRLVPRLTKANVADLVLLSMVTLPDQMPAAFHSTYTPIAAAGTEAQVRHLGRLLAVQLVVWAGEGKNSGGGGGDAGENLAQVESLLTSQQADERGAARRWLTSGSLPAGDEAEGELRPSKKRKFSNRSSAAASAAANRDAETEDALLRANVAKRSMTSHQMNISTLVGYGQQQEHAKTPGAFTSAADSLSTASSVPGLLSLSSTAATTIDLLPQQQQQQQQQQQNQMSSKIGFTAPPPSLFNSPPPMSGQAGSLPMMMTMPNLNQPPPPFLMMMMQQQQQQQQHQQQQQRTAAAAAASGLLSPPVSLTTGLQPAFSLSQGLSLLSTASESAGLTTTITSSMPIDIPAPSVPARPFCLDAMATMPMERSAQRQLARQAFLRLLQGLSESCPSLRAASMALSAVDATVDTANPELGLLASGGLQVVTGAGPQQAHQHFGSRMKLLTRLTTRRFGGNEFYNILIDHAIKNLRHGCFEVLSKLLTQEYCRFRGFQLVGYSDFLTSRRRQLTGLRGRHQATTQQQGPTSKSVEDAESPSSKPESGLCTALNNKSKDRNGTEEEEPYLLQDDRVELVDDSALGKEEDEEGVAATLDAQRASSAKADDGDRSTKARVEMKLDEKLTEETRKVLTPVASPDDLGCMSFYDCLLIDILQRLSDPQIRQSYFGRFLIEAPLLTPGAISVLKRYCWVPTQTRYGFQILRTVIELRPVGQREELLKMLLNFCSVDEVSEVRQAALAATRELASVHSKWRGRIEAFAIASLRKLLQPRPTPDIFPFSVKPMLPSAWNDDCCNACTHLFLGLMPQNPALMHKLADVYVGASPLVKRSILRMVDKPIREIGLYSADLHDLVDQCPSGAETLVTRMVHLLTDASSASAAAAAATASATATAAAVSSSAVVPGLSPAVTGAHLPPPVIVPPASLVQRIYRLYEQRVHDVRCLIPILVGLTRQQVLSALPRLVQLNEKVVKEVLSRLLHASVSTQYAPRIEGVRTLDGQSLPLLPSSGPAPLGPLSPEELLVAVHLLEFAKDPSPSKEKSAPAATDPDGKRKLPQQQQQPYVNLQAILHACRVCFSERRLFTQERLSATIGQLLEQPTLPTLFMRTVMQALALHPRLAGYVINVLVRLIRKKVWKSEKLWDGFIRCCIKTRPQSYQVLLQLPAERLESVFQREVNMRAQVRRYVENFSSAQRIHVSKSIIEVLERQPIAVRPTSPSADVQSAVPPTTALPTEASTPHRDSPSSSGPGTPTRDELPTCTASSSEVTALAFLLRAAAGGDTNAGTGAGLGLTASSPAVEPVTAQPSSISVLSSSTSSSILSAEVHKLSGSRKEADTSGLVSSISTVDASRLARTLRTLPSSNTTAVIVPAPNAAATGVDRIADDNKDEEDDLEPPILPSSRISAPPRRWCNLERVPSLASTASLATSVGDDEVDGDGDQLYAVEDEEGHLDLSRKPLGKELKSSKKQN